ncbi:protein of unknown function [Magnetospirillum sp. XM-1]|nr:protein of unknown function [Magnetospirillum sp. XM-1]
MTTPRRTSPRPAGSLLPAGPGMRAPDHTHNFNVDLEDVFRILLTLNNQHMAESKAAASLSEGRRLLRL